MKRKRKEYVLEANWGIELHESKHNKFISELTDVFVELVEKHNGYCGGGFKLNEYNEGDVL